MEHICEAEMKHLLDERLASHSFQNKAVFLFGHCNATELIADYLFEHGFRVTAILDNSKSKQEQSYRDIQILPPIRIKGFNASNSIVLIASRFFAEMSSQLLFLGYDGEIVQVAEFDSFSEHSLSNETIKKRTERMLRGCNTLKRMREEYPRHHLTICPNNALGDVYWAMAFLPAFCQKNGIEETTAVVIGHACRQTAELFDVKNIVTISKSEMDELVQAIIFTNEDNCIIAHHDRPYTDNIIKYLDKHFLSFIDYYRFAVYGLGNDATPAIPANIAAFENIAGIEKGNSVILSPYAKSIITLPPQFWEELAEECSMQGLHVYTNATVNEQPIKGTKPLSIPISQIIPAVEHAGAFTGIRNGLCDVLLTAKCRKTVVFPDCYYSTTSYKISDFFALPGWDSKLI